MARPVKILAVICCVLTATACSMVSTSPVVATRVPWLQEKNLSSALVKLRTGNETEARDLLEQVIAAEPLSGVTEEALFRLAVLRLREGGEKSLLRSQILLERLGQEYPETIWAKQAAPLASFLAEMQLQGTQIRQLTKLRERNLSLSRDNDKMRINLERLKKLDLELDQKSTR